VFAEYRGPVLRVRHSATGAIADVYPGDDSDGHRVTFGGCGGHWQAHAKGCSGGGGLWAVSVASEIGGAVFARQPDGVAAGLVEVGVEVRLEPQPWRGSAVALEGWLGGATACVTTWYDQSGRGNHATQADEAAQPVLCAGDGGGARLNFVGGRFLHLPDGTVPCGDSHYTVVCKHGSIENSVGGWLGSGRYGHAGEVNAFRRGGGGYVNYWWSNDCFMDACYKPGSVVACTYDGACRRGYVNGVPVTAAPVAEGRRGGREANTVGVTNGNEFLNGELHSLLVFDAPLLV
jgi:hypothetical protein